MAISNLELAKDFDEMADLLEIQGANPFRVRAYRNAARVIEGMSKNLADMVEKEADLTEIPGIGESIAEKIVTLVKKGQLPALKKLEKETPHVLTELMKIEGLGPRRVKILYDKLKVHSLDDLKKAVEQGKVRKLAGFGAKTEERIKSGILHVAEYSKRMKLADAVPVAEALLAYLKKNKQIEQVDIAGSYRRRKETVGDLDILVSAKNNKAVIDYFLQYGQITEVMGRGDTRAAVHLRSGLQVDLRVVARESYGAALLYFTGSKATSILLRKIAQQRKLKLNEYGIYKGKKSLAGKTETDVYRQIGLSYIEPELREDRGEIEAAQKNKLPKLITLQDIRGDLHDHTKATDGQNSIEEMVLAAKELGYEYIAITDHSKHLTVAGGLNEKELLKQIKVIDSINAKLKGITLLKAIEVDILEDGSLDLSDSVLKELDFTVCSVHSKFNLAENKQTERIIRAMDNKYFSILGHPSGRLINRREAYAINIEKIMRAAKERGCFLEINAQPERLDLDDTQIKLAKEMGVKMSISSDAHSISQLNLMKFGVFQARRGWLEADDVINTRSLSQLLKLLKR